MSRCPVAAGGIFPWQPQRGTTKLLIGQLLIILAILLASLWAATRWVAAVLAYQPEDPPRTVGRRDPPCPLCRAGEEAQANDFGQPAIRRSWPSDCAGAADGRTPGSATSAASTSGHSGRSGVCCWVGDSLRHAHLPTGRRSGVCYKCNQSFPNRQRGRICVRPLRGGGQGKFPAWRGRLVTSPQGVEIRHELRAYSLRR